MDRKSSNRYIRNGVYTDPPVMVRKKRTQSARFMEDTDFRMLTDIAMDLKKRSAELLDYVIVMEEEAASHHKNKLSDCKADVAEVLDKVSSDVTNFICEFYRCEDNA